jgi:hypothetical protein
MFIAAAPKRDRGEGRRRRKKGGRRRGNKKNEKLRKKVWVNV